MALDLRDCTFTGSALPEPFVKFELERHLAALSPLPPNRGAEGDALQELWDVYRRRLRRLADQGGEQRVLNHVIEPLAPLLGYAAPFRADEVVTREGVEDAGWWLPAKDGQAGIRAWTVPAGIDLDAPNKRGRAYRFSPSRVAARVLLAKGERAGLLTDGEELRLMLCDPARPDSHVSIALASGSGWRARRSLPDSFRLLLSLASPRGLSVLPELVDKARLAQSDVTKKLREQARLAVGRFVQGVLDDPANAAWRAEQPDAQVLARALWEEGLVLVYRLLFVLKMESAADPARAFSFAATSIWRNTFSPSTALAPVVRDVMARGAETGEFLEQSLRAMFKLFAEGLAMAGFTVTPLGGALFGRESTPTLDARHWGEHAVARLLDALLWTPGDGRGERERVHYGSLDVEDLGRVYEALLELEPGITTEPMCRLRRAKLEVVVPAAQGAQYRSTPAVDVDADDDAADDEDDEAEEDAPKRGKGKAKDAKTKVQWVEDIRDGKFYLRTGLGRKSSGSYYTPHPFVRFLVQETLGPQIAERSPSTDPQPLKILKLRVLDPAMGSGHFLVEACRYLGDALYEACRLCDDLAVKAEQDGDQPRADELRARVQALPDPNDELLAWLPSRVPEGGAPGLSQRRAEALCRRLVAVHCLYGVDKNKLAVELAKLALWLESYAEGMPLTFLDHRLLCGDSLTGPFVEHLFTFPGSGKPMDDDLLSQGLRAQLQRTLSGALAHVADLEATIGKDIADLAHKAIAKADLDRGLRPFRTLAAAWSGGVMLGGESDDLAYLRLVQALGAGGVGADAVLAKEPVLRRMVAVGHEGVAYDLAFPEVFHPDGAVTRSGGFDAVLGNPPWEGIQPDRRDFCAPYSLDTLIAPATEVVAFHERLLATNLSARAEWGALAARVEGEKRSILRLCKLLPRDDSGAGGGAVVDLFLAFADRSWVFVDRKGAVGLVLPNGFHTNLSGSLLRQNILQSHRLERVLGFNNSRSLFDIGVGMRFDLVIGRTGATVCRLRFGLDDPQVLFTNLQLLEVSAAQLTASGTGVLPEVASADELDIWQLTGRCADTFGKWAIRHGSRIGEELHSTKSAALFHPTTEFFQTDPRREQHERIWPLHEKGTITQYSDLLQNSPRACVVVDELLLAGRDLTSARYFRLAHRRVIHAQEQLKSQFALLPPRTQVSDSAVVEKHPQGYSNVVALAILGVLNSFVLNAIAKTKVGLNLSKHIRDAIAIPELAVSQQSLVCHSTLRLTCNHAGYAPLWTEQIADHWREPTPRHTWPVLADDDARWAVRAAIDAVVADAYGLDRAQYAHVLASFSHKSYPKAPTLCLAAFDELKAIGLDAFVRKHDPYWDVQLNESLPKPIIDLPVSGQVAPPTDSAGKTKAAPPRKAVSLSLFEDNGPLFGGTLAAMPDPDRKP